MSSWPAALDLAALVDAVIVFTLVEGAVLIAFHRRTGRGIPPRDFVLNLLSGVGLMLALRASVASAGTAAVALWLLGAGVLHMLDLALRWQRRAERTAFVGTIGAPVGRAGRKASTRARADLVVHREGVRG